MPSEWKALQQTKYVYYSRTDSLDKNKFFVVLKYNKKISGLSDNKYLAITYSKLMDGIIEKFTGYTTKKIIFQDKIAYYSQYFTRLNDKPYLTYSMVFDIDNNLYEFAMKADSASSIKCEKTFKDLLFNFRYKGNAVFASKAEIKDIQVVDLSRI
ncbi:hypothetical protein [Mucilaginibacter agri]|uniref:Uncharacterized protein n=1 Tax=Mucilaginibacter agri TaxID=2695265 RepID=A0A965ZF33_9SPHI|nr:hypothetical protein [Mucilaginibacter agri]NCD68819.1 hypothetical protein [Mucilaginibacter agri]